MDKRESYLIPRVDWNDFSQLWDAVIEERKLDGTDETVFAWHIRECATPFEALEAVTTEFVRMASNTFAYYLDAQAK